MAAHSNAIGQATLRSGPSNPEATNRDNALAMIEFSEPNSARAAI